MKTLVLFRRDLRLQDNLALFSAIEKGQDVEALYVLPTSQSWSLGAATKWYLHHSLLSLQKDLAAINVRLKCMSGEPNSLVYEYVKANQITSVYLNRVVEPEIEKNDKALREQLEITGVKCHLFDDDCLVMPECGYKNDGSAYRVFTPFWKSLQQRLETSNYLSRLCSITTKAANAVRVDASEIEQLNLLSTASWHHKFHQYWIPGEASALARLDEFLETQIDGYIERRDFPAKDSTSHLSAAFHFGEISVVRVYWQCNLLMMYEQRESVRNCINRFLTEIAWRDFARHVLHANPSTTTQSLNRKFDQNHIWIKYKSDELTAWKTGNTGIPIIDAGMCELWETGSMHNRVRMLVASFLTKNLGIHWLEGARWFWDTLIDADLASNTLGWQWVAGCGTDAAPYYRIFNPELQAKKFDADAQYINRWLKSGCFHQPIVDLKASREDALLRYKDMNDQNRFKAY